jgi:hypothetical protein
MDAGSGRQEETRKEGCECIENMYDLLL